MRCSQLWAVASGPPAAWQRSSRSLEKRQGKVHVVQHTQVGQQIELLEHHTHMIGPKGVTLTRLQSPPSLAPARTHGPDGATTHPITSPATCSCRNRWGHAKKQSGHGPHASGPAPRCQARPGSRQSAMARCRSHSSPFCAGQYTPSIGHNGLSPAFPAGNPNGGAQDDQGPPATSIGWAHHQTPASQQRSPNQIEKTRSDWVDRNVGQRKRPREAIMGERAQHGPWRQSPATASRVGACQLGSAMGRLKTVTVSACHNTITPAFS